MQHEHPTTGPEDLDAVRNEIDRIDEALVELLSTRRGLALRAAAGKRVRGVALRDLEREAEIARRASGLARMRGLDPEIVRDLFWRILSLSHVAVEAAAGETER